MCRIFGIIFFLKSAENLIGWFPNLIATGGVDEEF